MLVLPIVGLNRMISISVVGVTADFIISNA